MGGMSSQVINWDGDPMRRSWCFGCVELEMQEGHPEAMSNAHWGVLSRGSSKRTGGEYKSTSGWVEIILQVDEVTQTQSHCWRTDPGEADIDFHPRGRAPHLSCGWSATQLFMFIRLIPKHCLPPLISLSIYCLQNSQDRQRQTTPQMLNWLNYGEGCLFNLPLWLFGVYGA